MELSQAIDKTGVLNQSGDQGVVSKVAIRPLMLCGPNRVVCVGNVKHEWGIAGRVGYRKTDISRVVYSNYTLSPAAGLSDYPAVKN